MRALQPGEAVCVTGASGYIGSWVTKSFLEAGHPVHATVRDPEDTTKTAHLLRDAEAAGTPLKLFAADLTEPGSFDEAVEGCAAVIHVASPFLLADRIKDARRDLVEPAEQGTVNVLESVERFPEVRRVVLTASVVSTYGDNIDVQGRPVTDKDWNTTSSVDHQPYPYSKTLAERRAWEMAEAQDRWDLVTIHPGLVAGPSRSQRLDATSVTLIRDLLTGKYKTGFPDLYFGVVDVRDVAQAHLLAARSDDATGRYICAGETVNAMEIADHLRKVSNGLSGNLPKKPLPKALLYLLGPFLGFSWKFISRNVGVPIEFDHSRLRDELGLQLRPFEQTVVDHVEQLKSDGLLEARG